MARVRRIKGTRERLAASPYAVNTPHDLVGQWQTIYPDPRPLLLEVGCGRGRFLYEMAQADPSFNYLGMDVIPEILMEALDQWARKENFPQNIRYLCLDADLLDEIFAPGEVNRLYLHFSDPWPKNRHAKRRLTHARFLARYEKILAADAQVLFKTDSMPFFDFSLASFQEAGWRILSHTYDLYADPLEDNIATEYERRFVRQGLPICRLIALPPERL